MTLPIRVDISAGELLDKIAILELKARRTHEPEALVDVLAQLAALEDARRRALPQTQDDDDLASLVLELKRTNDILWRLRDELKVHEEEMDFGPAFVERARGIARETETRTLLKRRIDLRAAALAVGGASAVEPSAARPG